MDKSFGTKHHPKYTHLMIRAYEEIIDFIAAGSTPGDVVAWTPSQAAKDRVAELLQNEKAGTLAPDDRAELNHYLELEHLMRLAKARARQSSAHE
jgi:hypothetical protein